MFVRKSTYTALKKQCDQIRNDFYEEVTDHSQTSSDLRAERRKRQELEAEVESQNSMIEQLRAEITALTRVPTPESVNPVKAPRTRKTVKSV